MSYSKFFYLVVNFFFLSYDNGINPSTNSSKQNHYCFELNSSFENKWHILLKLKKGGEGGGGL